jgi:hypothetical protein
MLVGDLGTSISHKLSHKALKRSDLALKLDPVCEKHCHIDPAVSGMDQEGALKSWGLYAASSCSRQKTTAPEQIIAVMLMQERNAPPGQTSGHTSRMSGTPSTTTSNDSGSPNFQ